MPDDPDIGSAGAFCCVASLSAQGRLSRLASALRPKKSGVDRAAARCDSVIAAALEAATAAWSTDKANGDKNHDDDDDGRAPPDVGSPTCRLVRAGSSALTNGASGGGGGSGGAPIELFTFPHAGLAVRPCVCDIICLCPILGAPATASSTLARVVPYVLATQTAAIAIAGNIDNAAELERRFAPRTSASSSSSSAPSWSLRGVQSAPLPSFVDARDAALADEVACLSLTPPGGSAAAAAAAAVPSPSSARTRSAALSGVRRAVDAGESAARAVLALVEDALCGPGARAADSPAQALTLALAEITGSFALALHDAEKGFTLAARDASGEEEELWFAFAPDGGSIAFASPRPLDLGAAGDWRWHPLPAGHFVVFGGGFGRQPRLHQFALTPDQLRVRAASHEPPPASQRWGRKRDGVALSAAVTAAATDEGDHGAGAGAGAAAPASPRSSSFDDVLYE